MPLNCSVSVLLLVLVLCAAALVCGDERGVQVVAAQQRALECNTKSYTGNVTCSARNCCNGRCKTDGAGKARCLCSRPSEACKGPADCCKDKWSCKDSKCQCLAPESECKDSMQCCSGKCSTPYTNRPKLCGCSKEKQYCGSDLDCCLGFYCTDEKKCKPKVEIGKKCKTDPECTSSKCSGNKCVCSPRSGGCVKRADCCLIAGKPAAAVGCVLGKCGDCVTSSPGAEREIQTKVCPAKRYAKKVSEACCSGKCSDAPDLCDYPIQTGEYCTIDEECALLADTCVDNKCTTTKCLVNGKECRKEGAKEGELDCCGNLCSCDTSGKCYCKW